MINRENHPVGWSLLLYELSDAYEHLGSLLGEAAKNPNYSETELRIDLGHVYAHLNRAWFRRNMPEGFAESEWDAASKFPEDIEPVA